ncbi:pyruvate decarboxylase [Striga asiatica]|uniref:Pyruvate decarboxylase n=1 Tax=Striga asiatica TaxID=4170 RepID=A0A5A7PUW0_STRAF|nr:pyruvate decarboxylase [Striga asiatica]
MAGRFVLGDAPWGALEIGQSLHEFNRPEPLTEEANECLAQRELEEPVFQPVDDVTIDESVFPYSSEDFRLDTFRFSPTVIDAFSIPSKFPVPGETRKKREGNWASIRQHNVNQLDVAHELINTAISTALKKSKSVYISISCNLPAIPHPTFSRALLASSASPSGPHYCIAGLRTH